MGGRRRTVLALALLAAFAGVFFGSEVRAAKIIGVGDYLQVSVLGAPEFTRLVKVREDGTVAYPYVTDVPVVGMTTTEMQTLLVTILQRYMDNPVVLIEMPANYTVHVQVLGQVRRPGSVQVPVGTDVQSAVSLAGGPAEHADASRAEVLRPAGTREDGSPKWDRIPANLNEFLATGNIRKLPKLQENDIVVVPSVTNSSSVMIVGWVVKPGNYVPYPDSNVLNMVLRAGGFKPDGDRTNVRHLYEDTPGHYVEQTLDLDAMISEGKIRQIPPANGGDVVIVSQYDPFFTWDRALAIMRDVSVIAGAYLLYLRIDRLEN